MKPSMISFTTGRAKGLLSDVEVEIVEAKNQRSEIEVVVDQAGESCIKTPHAIPKNLVEKGDDQ